MTLFICTVGTSIMGGPFRSADYAYQDLQIDNRLSKIDQECEGDVVRFLVRASAETNALSRADCGPSDTVALLATDTADGLASSQGLSRLIERTLGSRCEVIPIPGLQVGDAEDFQQSGIRNLIQTVYRRGDKARRAHESVVLNVTGGFKGVVPYLTVLGMMEGFETLYIYDQSDALIRLPSIPIRFDLEAISFALPALQTLAARSVMEADAFAALLFGHEWRADPGLRFMVEESDGVVALSAAADLALRALDLGVSKGRLFVHRRARQSGLLDSQPVRRALAHINIPNQRVIPAHCSRHRNTDMVYWKTRGHSAPRIFYWIDGEDTYVAEILPHSGAYDREFLQGSMTIWRNEYGLEQFEEHHAFSISTEEDGIDSYGEALSEWLDALELERTDLSGRVKNLDTELKKVRERNKNLTRQHAEREAIWGREKRQLEHEISIKAQKIGNLTKVVAELSKERQELIAVWSSKGDQA